MARKKQQTYNEMIQMMDDMQKKIDTEKEHMAEVLASQLDYETARILGDLSDNEVRCVAALMFRFIRLFRNLALLKPQLQGAEDESKIEGELKYNPKENCWEVWDTDTGKKVGTLSDGMCVELSDGTDDGDWETVEVGVSVMDSWYAKRKSNNGSDAFKKFTGLFNGLRVRFRGRDD